MKSASAAVCMLLVAVPSAGQRVVDIQSRSVCRQCRIRIAPVLTLSDVDGRASLSLPNIVARDGRGQTLIVSGVAPSEIAVFGPAGRLVVKAGRNGAGPGEYRRIDAIAVHNDTIDVFDGTLGRWTQLDTLFEVIRTISLPHDVMRAVHWGMGLVINSSINTPDLVGYPIHEVSASGLVVRSFGYDSLTYRTDIPYADIRAMTVCPNGTLWWAGKREYRIDGLTHLDGAITLRRRADWFRPHVSRPRYTVEAGPPPPLLMDIACDQRNRLWTLIAVADTRWRSAGLRQTDADSHGSAWLQRFLPDRYFDTIIEVIETETGQLLASSRNDYWLPYLPVAGIAASYQDREGPPRVILWSLDLQEPPSSSIQGRIP